MEGYGVEIMPEEIYKGYFWKGNRHGSGTLTMDTGAYRMEYKMDQIIYQEAIQDNGVGVKLKDLNPKGQGEGVF